ncbi:DDE-domain-containing protein, partial [Dendrothele bispora CBS 962.96]
SRVAGGAGKRTQHQQGGTNRENTTAIVTICADGTTLCLMIIFKGTNLWSAWCQHNVANATFACSPKGWTDSQIAIHWIKTQFDPQTRNKAQGRCRALFMDGHSTHFTEPVIEFGLSVGIRIAGYPPHCTHALQGLDVVRFAKMKTELKKTVADFEEEYQHPVAKADFTRVFGTAFIKSFMEDSVHAAWKATGLHPFDPSAIKPEQMKPAEAKSVKGLFALTQTSPVKAIIKSFQTYSPLEVEIDPSNAHAPISAIPSSSQTTPGDMPPVPTPTSIQDDTPSKRMRILTSSLAVTSSGSFLISKTPYTSLTPFPRLLQKTEIDIPEPDWSLI